MAAEVIPTSAQSASTTKTNDASNVTELVTDISASAPSASTSDVSNVLTATEAGQSNVGDDAFTSSVGSTTVNVSGTLEKGLSNRTLLACCAIIAAAFTLYGMYVKKGRSKEVDPYA